MAELLVRIVDQVGDTPYLHAKLLQSGHVVAICEDGWAWSKEERTSSLWTILSFPGIAASAFDQYAMDERAQRITDSGLTPDGIPKDPKADHRTNPMLQSRAWRFDVTKLQASVKQTLLAPRTGKGVLAVPKHVLDVVMTKFIEQPDPNVLG